MPLITGHRRLFVRRAVAATFVASMLITARPATAATILAENFDNVANLVPSGWKIVNNSAPIGGTDWFQGNPAVFNSQSGAANSYVAANFNAADFGGNISDWLISPMLTLENLETISFWTRTEAGSTFPDRLELRLSVNGASTNVGATDASVGDFSTLLFSVNPAVAPGGYPENWAFLSVTISGLGGPTNGRFAFRYTVPDTSLNADYIGIDTVRVNSAPVPEPATILLVGLGLLGSVRARRQTRRS